MFLLRIHLVFCVGLFIWKAGAQVNLTDKNPTGMNSFACGDDKVLKCTIDPYLNTMSWTKNTSATPLASCSPTKCSVNPTFTSEYNFTFNESSGIFEMTIIKVALTDQGTTYSCDNGVNSASVTADVMVNEEISATRNDQQFDSNTTEVRASTGCIKNTTKVTFIWWAREAKDTTGEKIFLNDSYESDEDHDDSACKANTDCWISGFTKKTRRLNITEERTGKLYKVGVDVVIGVESKPIPLEKNSTFMLNLPVTVTVTVPPIPLCPCCIGLVIAYLVIWIVQLQMCIYGYSQGSSYLFHGCTKCFVVLQIFTHVPLLGLTPAIYIYRSIPKSGRRYITWYTIFASAPVLGIFVKVVLAWRKKKTDRQNCWIVVLFVAMGTVSMVEEIFVILLCVVWGISQWYYPFIIALGDLITRWALFIIIAVLYHADIRGTNTHREDVPLPLAFGIALWCTPIIGTVFIIYWKYRQEPVRCLSDGHKVSAEDKMKSPGKEITPREETHKRKSKQQVASLPEEKNDKTTPRALPKIPRVRSSNMLSEQATEIHTKLPPIQYRKM